MLKIRLPEISRISIIIWAILQWKTLSFSFARYFSLFICHVRETRKHYHWMFRSSIYNMLKRVKNYFRRKYFIDTPIQFKRCLFVTNNIKGYVLTRHFLYSLTYHYSPVDLQKKTAILPEFFLEFICINIRNMMVSKNKTLLFSWAENIDVFVIKFCNL